MDEFFIFIVGAVITAIMAFLKVAVPFPELGWFWVFVPVIVALGIIILPFDSDCG